MSAFITLHELPERELLPGFHARLIHTDHTTVAHFRVEKGSVLPEHAHPHEQITNLIAGEFEMTVGGETRLCRAGESVCIPSGVPHAGRALSDCLIIDVFNPAREDYR